MTAKQLKKRIEAYLKENRGLLALNFSGVTRTERSALLLFLKDCGAIREIKIVSIDSLRADMADVVNYAKSYFEVFGDVEGLTASLT